MSPSASGPYASDAYPEVTWRHAGSSDRCSRPSSSAAVVAAAVPVCAAAAVVAAAVSVCAAAVVAAADRPGHLPRGSS